ncbi:MAG: hypothetical protein AAFQ82_27630, partial [Myxococcota bacterium]
MKAEGTLDFTSPGLLCHLVTEVTAHLHLHLHLHAAIDIFILLQHRSSPFHRRVDALPLLRHGFVPKSD